MIGLLIVAAVWGALTLALASTAFYYRGRVKSAEFERNEAVRLANEAMAAKKLVEEGFKQAKEWFEKNLARPAVAVLTDEQLDTVAKYLGGRLLPYTSTISPVKN
jgi:hypothetical protein